MDSGSTPVDAAGPSPTPAEARVLRLIAADHDRTRAAAALGIRLPTIDFHLANLRRKAGVQTTAGLVYRAVHLRWLGAPSLLAETGRQVLEICRGDQSLLMLLAADNLRKQAADTLGLPCCRSIDAQLKDLRRHAGVRTNPGLIYRAIACGWLVPPPPRVPALGRALGAVTPAKAGVQDRMRQTSEERAVRITRRQGIERSDPSGGFPDPGCPPARA